LRIKPHERLGAADIGRRHHQVEASGRLLLYKVADAPIALARDGGDDGIAIEPKKRHGGRQDGGAFVFALVEELARGAGDDGMDAAFAQMRRRHHGSQCRFDWSARIGQEIGDPGKGFVRLGVENMENRADEERMAGLLPMIAALQRAFGVDEDIGDVLDIADFPFAAPDLQQGIVGGA
jgi:hypothetical protein